MSQVYEAMTGAITVQVRVFYLAERSNPDSGEYFWAYHITIINRERFAVQLLRRTWHITDGNGHAQMVHGEGVVGEQPVMGPGERYEYTSGTPLSTPSGFMVGKYHMRTVPAGAAFDIAVPAFSLDSPHENTPLH